MNVCPADGTRLYRVDDDDPLIGGVIDGRFRIDYTLGIGGMGTVYGGVQLSVNRDVAVKVLRTELSTREVALERFFREAKTISNLSHPNVVKLIDFGQDRDRGLLYLVMELVRGHNLADLIDRGRLRTSLALEVVYQVSGALTEPHAAGVIHRDLKPDNLLLVPVTDGTLQAKVLDFGIARFMESNTQLTGTGMICGTPAYMAPEQAQNETLDSRTDLYALGVILYEMLSGWPPFSGTSSLQVMLKHIQEKPQRLRDLLPPAALPESIEQLAYELMAKERSARPESARIVRDRIEVIRKELGFQPVRLETDGEFEERFSDFVLPKLPRPDKQKSGPTQVLRRETGLEPEIAPGRAPDPEESRPTNVWVGGDTQADERLGVTGPLTPDGKMSVLGDAERVKLGTRGGGQQAWTPGDQAAVRSIKDTKDGIDAFGKTEASTPSAEQPEARHTMVEDNSEPLLGIPPGTEDTLPAANSGKMRVESDQVPTSERQSPASSSNTKLVLAAILGGLMTIGAAAYVVQKIDEVVSRADGTPTVAPTVTATSAEPQASVDEDPSHATVDLREALGAAHESVHDGLAAGTEKLESDVESKHERAETTPRPTKPTRVRDSPEAVAPVKPPEKGQKTDRSNDSADPEAESTPVKRDPRSLIESKGLRDDG